MVDIGLVCTFFICNCLKCFLGHVTDIFSPSSTHEIHELEKHTHLEYPGVRFSILSKVYVELFQVFFTDGFLMFNYPFSSTFILFQNTLVHLVCLNKSLICYHINAPLVFNVSIYSCLHSFHTSVFINFYSPGFQISQ